MVASSPGVEDFAAGTWNTKVRGAKERGEFQFCGREGDWSWACGAEFG